MCDQGNQEVSHEEIGTSNRIERVIRWRLGSKARAVRQFVDDNGPGFGITWESYQAFTKRHGTLPPDPVCLQTWLNDDAKKVTASEIGVDWEGLTEFMEALMPLIIEMMEMCSAMSV